MHSSNYWGELPPVGDVTGNVTNDWQFQGPTFDSPHPGTGAKPGRPGPYGVAIDQFVANKSMANIVADYYAGLVAKDPSGVVVMPTTVDDWDVDMQKENWSNMPMVQVNPNSTYNMPMVTRKGQAIPAKFQKASIVNAMRGGRSGMSSAASAAAGGWGSSGRGEFDGGYGDAGMGEGMGGFGGWT